MVFSDTTGKLGIIQACERYTNSGDAGISGDTLLIKEFTAHANKSLRSVWHDIFMSYGGWQYEDSNQTDLPASTTNLVNSQNTYALPSTALTVRGIEVLLDDGTTWQQLKPITEEQIRDKQSMGEFCKTDGVPEYYQLVGSTVRLFPASNYAETSGFKVFYDRGSVAFASTDTTKTPGFASEYHDIVPIEASIEYLKVKTPGDATLAILRADAETLRQRIKSYYAKRWSQMFPPRITVRDVARDAV